VSSPIRAWFLSASTKQAFEGFSISIITQRTAEMGTASFPENRIVYALNTAEFVTIPEI
jgi:hypothetical protein